MMTGYYAGILSLTRMWNSSRMHFPLQTVLYIIYIFFLTKAGYLAGTHYILEGLVFFWYAVPKEGQDFPQMQFLSNT